jgi:HlyD family secretion protein
MTLQLQSPQKSAPARRDAVQTMRRLLVGRPPDLPADASLTTRLERACEHEMRTGLRILVIGGAMFGLWGGLAPLSGAVVMSGALVSESRLKKVQHPTGGVIATISVREGDKVKAGDPLLRLDDISARANLQIVARQLDALRARRARLLAERDEAEDVATPAAFARRAGDPELAALLASERALFKARRVARAGQRELLFGRIGQLEEEIQGLDAQMKSQATQRALADTELKGVETLYKKQLTPLARLTALQREAARIDGTQGQLQSSVAETRSKIDEAKLQVARLDQDFRAELGKDLREAEDKEAELVERETAARDVLSRIELRAPASGVVHQLAVHTVGGVVSPGEVLMEIVPNADELQIEAHLPPQDIDQAHVGQEAQARFPAFNQRTTPELSGKVSFVSADAARDANGGSHYVVRVNLSGQEIARLGSLKLVPGMPAEVFLKTGSRTMASYLLKPIGDQFSRMFRER